jgi:type II secretory pathway pseudopilin PulG
MEWFHLCALLILFKEKDMNARIKEAGFSYIDVMIAVVILLIGITALVGAIAGAVIRTRDQEQQLNAKQIATSTMESIISVKETDPNRLGWDKLGNVGSNPVGGVPQGIFLVGNQSVRANAGPDEVLGTADDSGDILPGIQRQIVITDICDPDRRSPAPVCDPPGTMPVMMRRVEVTITYFANTLQRQERITTILTKY